MSALLGLSGATTLLGTATSPNQAPQRGEERAGIVPARVADLLTDWNGNADLSRYQYFVLTLFGAAVFASAFFRDLQFVEVPKEILLALGASQATYLGTKAVKAGKNDDAQDSGGRAPVPPVVVAAAPPVAAPPAPQEFRVERT